VTDLETLPISELRVVRTYFVVGPPQNHMVLASDVDKLVQAQVELHGGRPFTGNDGKAASSARYRLAMDALMKATQDYDAAISSMSADELMALRAYRITVQTLGFDGPYWWSTPGAPLKNEPFDKTAGARLIRESVEVDGWIDMVEMRRLYPEEYGED